MDDQRRRERVTLLVSADELARLDEWATSASMTRSDVIRAALGLVVTAAPEARGGDNAESRVGGGA